MASLFSGASLAKNGGGLVDSSILEGKTLLLFFGALWCPHSRAFTPDLKKFYRECKENHANFEVVFVSLDENEHDMNLFLAEDHDDWLYLRFGDPLIQKLDDMRAPGHVNRLPVLMIVAPDGTVITQQGVVDVMSEKSPRQVFDDWLHC